MSADRLLVLDLDGTVLVGDEPVRAYLRAIVTRAPLSVDAETALDAFLAAGGDAADGYSFVAGLAAGVPEAVRSAAYADSRRALHAGAVGVGAAEGLPELLAQRPSSVACALVTNAPVAGVLPLLDRLGLAGAFDRLIGDAGKPTGMAPVLLGLLAETGVAPSRLLAVGDVWANDLAAAAELGGATALVDRWGRGGGPGAAPTAAAPTLTELLPAIRAWWS